MFELTELEFRGIAEGRWIYGDKITNGRDALRHKFKIGIGQPGYYPEKIDSLTLGIWTGKRDNKRNDEFPNGQKIFTGDILNLMNSRGESINVKCCIGEFPRAINGYTVLANGIYFEHKDGFKSIPIKHNHLGKSDYDIMTVVGNIHDNPELW